MRELFINLRRNHLLILFTLGFFVTIGVVLLELDRQRYQSEKRRYIIDNWNTLFPFDKERLTQSARLILETTSPEARQQQLAAFSSIVNEILESALSIYSIELLDAQGNRLFARELPEKLRQYNTFKNCLFLRSFSSKADNYITSGTGKEMLGRLILNYTTPAGDKFIEALTRKYRWIALAILGPLPFIYLYLLKYLLLPVKRVITFLDKAKTSNPEIIKAPGSYLERVYNNLARDALLSRINHKIQEFAATVPLPQLSEIYQQLPEILIDLFHFPAVSIWEIKKTSQGKYEITNSYYRYSEDQRELIKALQYNINRLVKEESAQTIERLFEHNLKLMFVNKQKLWWFIDLIYHSEEYDVFSCVVIVPLRQAEKELSDWDIETLRLIARQLRDGINAIEFQRRVIFKEKSETKINLARRLGHDLTNIIATSKLDLMTIAHYLESKDVEALRREDKNSLVRQALNGLLNNTKFLQEIVDIYRSFSFIKQPVYRQANINHLLDEIVDVFATAMSRNIKIIKNYQKDLPECVVEERLLKLALFNLLSNAQEAITSNASPGQHKGQIIISTTYNPETEDIYISIRDTGPGIRNADGELITPGEMDKLFLPGYTTKKDEDSEGLGLNWVGTIVTEFHRGRVIPANHPEGGAEFTICLNRAVLAKEQTVKTQQEMNSA